MPDTYDHKPVDAAFRRIRRDTRSLESEVEVKNVYEAEVNTMTIDTNTIVSITEVNQNVSRVARIAKKSNISIIVVLALLAFCSGCERFEQKSSISLENYQIEEYSEKTGHPVLTITENEESDKKVFLKMDGQEDLAKAMYRYSGMIAINATYSSDRTLLDYTIQDLFTGESYGKLDAKGLYDTFDPGRFEIVEKDYQKEIRLSELITDVTYKYEDVNKLSDGRIINDTGRNIRVYYDNLSDHQSKRFCLFGRCISGVEDSSVILPPPQKNFMIRFQDAETDDMVRFNNDNMIRLSNYHSGDSFYVNFQTALYNDTGQDAELTRTDGTEIGIAADQWIRLDWNVEDFRTFESDFEVK